MENEKLKMMFIPTKGVMFAEEVELSIDKVPEMLGAGMFEIVHPVKFEDEGRDDFVLLVNESGATKENAVMNPCASELYGWRRHGARIYGDVLIAKEIETDDGTDLTGLDEDDIDELYGILYSV